MLEIVEPASNSRLISIQAARVAIGLADGDPSEDAALEPLIDQASAVVTAWCDRPFALEMVRETVRERVPSDGLMLARWPIVSVASVAVDGTEFGPEDYVADKQTGILYRRSATVRALFWSPGETVVQYRSGYILPGDDGRTLPLEVEYAAISLLKVAHASGLRDPLLRSVEVVGLDTITYFAPTASFVPLEVQGLLAGYRRQAVG